MNKKTYEKLINENIEWLEKIHPTNSLEKDHTIAVLKDSIRLHYPEKNVITNIVYTVDKFDEALKVFMKYQPVKVERLLKDEFHDYISKHCIVVGISKWSCIIYPLKKSYKFKRTTE